MRLDPGIYIIPEEGIRLSGGDGEYQIYLFSSGQKQSISLWREDVELAHREDSSDSVLYFSPKRGYNILVSGVGSKIKVF